MSRLLITGGSGFIGSSLVRSLIDSGHSVANLDAGTYAAVAGSLEEVESNPAYQLVKGSISNPKLVKHVISEFRPDYVINLAAESHVDRSIDRPAPFVQSNIAGTAVLLEACNAYWKKLPRSESDAFRFVQVSTDEVFGSLETGSAVAHTAYNPTSPYAASKAAADHLVRSWYRTYGLPSIVTISCNNYGPYQFPEKLIPLAITRSIEGRSIPIYGDGRQVRDWIHVTDHCRALWAVCENGSPGNTYLIGARTRITNLELIELVTDQLDLVSPRTDGLPHRESIEHVTDRPGHDRRYAIDPSSVEELGFSAQIALHAGIRSTVRWYVDNRRWWGKILEKEYDTERLGLPA